MVVERIDNIITTVLKTHQPLRAIKDNERTWSDLEGSILISLKRGQRVEPVIGEMVTKIDEETILYTKERMIADYVTMCEQEVLKREEINYPHQPWHGKVRYRKEIEASTLKSDA